MTNLRAPYGQADSSDELWRPGVHKDSDGPHLHSHAEAAPGQVQPRQQVEHHHGLGKGIPKRISQRTTDYPITEDPNDYPIYLARFDTATHCASSFASGGWAKIGSGINSYGLSLGAWIGARHDIWVDRGTALLWQLFIRASQLRATVTNYFLNRVRCTDGSKGMPRSQNGSSAAGRRAWRSICFTLLNSNTMSGVYFKDCTIGDWHEICHRNSK